MDETICISHIAISVDKGIRQSFSINRYIVEDSKPFNFGMAIGLVKKKLLIQTC